MSAPRVSVVMAVFNGEADVGRAAASVLSQNVADFELVVVDDGSTDGSAEVVRSLGDPRVRLISQANAGLTKALIRGCAESRGEVIARQDADDVSLPGRLAAGLAALDDPEVVLTACETAFVGPAGEPLYTTELASTDVTGTLRTASAQAITGLSSHGAAMFRADAYRRAGGYRTAFYFGQDLDLWIRMAALGRVVVTPETLYEHRVDAVGISGRRRAEQQALTEIAVRLRDGDGDAAELLRQAEGIRGRAGAATRRETARALYFIGACLRRRRDPRHRDYLRRAVANDPFHLRAWAALLAGPRK